MINESMWADAHKKNIGIEDRNEDKFNEFDQKMLDTFIEMFVYQVVYECDYYDNFSDFTAFIKDFANNPRVKDADVSKILKYIKDNEDNVWDKVYGMIKDAWEEEHGETYPEDGLSESMWADAHKKNIGIEDRKESTLDEKNKKFLDEYVYQFAHNVVWYGEYNFMGKEDISEFVDFIGYYDNDDFEWDPDDDAIISYVTDPRNAKKIVDMIIPEIGNEEIARSANEDYDDKELDESMWADAHKKNVGIEDRRENCLDDINQKALEKYMTVYTSNDSWDGYKSRGIDTLHFFKNYIIKHRMDFKWNVDMRGYDVHTILDYVESNWNKGMNISKKLDDMWNKNINECDSVAPNGGLTFGDVSGMGPITLPGECGEKGSGDLPMPSGKVYQQVAPFGVFVKTLKSRKKKKKFRKEDEPCSHSPNGKMYNYVDDYREYVDRTYNQVDKIK